MSLRLLNVSTNLAWAPTHTCAHHVCVCVCACLWTCPCTVSYLLICGMCVRSSAGLHAPACLRLWGCVCFMIFFYCLFVCARSGTLYSAVVLLVSIKFGFILGYSSVWYETQRQDGVSVGRPIKHKQHLVTVSGSKTNRAHKANRDTSTAIRPENYIFGCYRVSLSSLDVNC